jgi:hypothetical protein
MKRQKLNWLDPKRIRLLRDLRGITLTVDTVVTPGLFVVRAYPETHPEAFFALRDRNGATIGILESLEGLEPASRQILEEVLAEQIFRPEILDVTGLYYKDCYYYWKVETTAGPRAFRSHHGWHQLPVARNGSGEVLIWSEDGIQYRIQNLESLSDRARKLLYPVV